VLRESLQPNRQPTPDERKPFSAHDAGLYAVNGRQSHAVIRCVQFHSRPAHADQLHLDLWWRGENVACDAGSYLYSGDPPWENSLAHAGIHNTVTVDGADPMRQSGRFAWTDLAQGEGGFVGCSGEWRGTQNGYRALGIIHHRRVEPVEGDVWIVTDDLIGRGIHSIRMHWLVPDYPWERTQPVLEPMIREMVRKRMAELGGVSSDREFQLGLQTPAGNLALFIVSNKNARWNMYRAGEPVFGEKERVGPVPPEIRGWRSLRYADKLPALSLAGTADGVMPIRFISVWTLLDGQGA
jgi:Heparinase II/III-like protein